MEPIHKNPRGTILLQLMALHPVLGPSRCQDFFPSVSISALLLQPLIPRVLRSSSTPSNHLSSGLPARLLPSGLSKVSLFTGFSSSILIICVYIVYCNYSSCNRSLRARTCQPIDILTSPCPQKDADDHPASQVSQLLLTFWSGITATGQ